ncbi:MAG: molybdopterin-dependent oxidoreductase [Myxococcota bacterium]
MKSTRRGFLRGTVVGATALGTGCTDRLRTEVSEAPADAPAPEARVRVQTEVNGTARTLDVDPDQSALQAVRDQLGLTGCKHGCGHGACGACTMQLDGTPVATCLLPATSLQGRRVKTVEGIAVGGSISAVQRAFIAEDGLQCGYCTPGFIVESEAFVTRWRAEHGTTVPDRETVADALSGHLCRCAAYEAIYRAVQGACGGRYDAGPDRGPRYDAKEKVTGDARYTVDVVLPGMLHAKALHSPHAHATITRLDWSKALALPGVRGAVDLMDGRTTVRHAGQELVAIAAVDEETAARAVALVDVAYDVKPAATSIAAARALGAPLVYGKRRGRKSAPNASEGPMVPLSWDGNVRGPMGVFSKKGGKAKRALEDATTAGTAVSGRWTTSVQCHTTLEPHAAVAHWPREDALEIHLSTQAVRHCAEDLAERFKLKRENVAVIADYIGAGFGSKGKLESEAIIAAELARVCGAPVRYVLERREELMIGGHRPESEIELSAAVDEGGGLAVKAAVYSNSGVAVGHAVTPMLRILYPEAHKDLEDYDVVTHGPPGKPFRGPGGPQAYWALEQAVDALAHQRAEDPLALRQRWDPNPARQPLYAWAQDLEVWRDRAAMGADKGRYRRGVGLAFGAWFTFCEPKTRVQLDVGPDGVTVSTSTQDMGNGTRTVLAKTVGEALGIAPHDVDVRVGHSKYVHGPMSAGSRTVSSLVPACVVACDALKEELLDDAKDRMALRGAVATDAGVEHQGGVVPWSTIIASSPPISVVGRRPRDKGGWFLPPLGGLAVEKYVSASIQIMQVEVDTRLGRTRAVEGWGGIAVGKLVSPTLARSQIAGGILQATSYALYEERRLEPMQGYLLSGGLEDYRVMGLGDAPALNIHVHERGYEKVPQRSTGIGELVTLAPAPAIGNAMFHATGWRPHDLPLRPDRVLKGLRG